MDELENTEASGQTWSGEGASRLLCNPVLRRLLLTNIVLEKNHVLGLHLKQWLLPLSSKRSDFVHAL